MEEKKMKFYKKVWYSITKIEKYPEMAAQGFGKAFSYLSIMVAILAIVLSIGMIYTLNTQEGTEIINSIKDAVPEDISFTDVELYVAIFLISFIYTFAMLLILTALNALYISIIGYLSSLIAHIKIRYIAIYNMAIYSLTLSIILCIIYITINTFMPFEIKYFDVMYNAVAAIYIVAAILLLKEDITKKQAELMKIIKEEEIIRRQMEEQEQQENEKQEKEERRKKDKEEKKEESNGEEPCTFIEERNE